LDEGGPGWELGWGKEREGADPDGTHKKDISFDESKKGL